MVKTQKYRRSKYQFPTRIVKNGTKGAPVYGANSAKTAIENQLGRPLMATAKPCHTTREWCWREPC
jgi:hypothetical protein